MCGIAGVLQSRRSSPVDHEALRAGFDEHRAPGSGRRRSSTSTDRSAWPIAACRSSTSHPRPPAHDQRGRDRLADLQRRDLQLPRAAHGCSRRAVTQFRSHTDSEVPRCTAGRSGAIRLVDRLNGIFAFAIWDGRARELFLARDRFGVKPLYLSRRRRPTAVRLGGQSNPRLPRLARHRLSLPALMEYMTFQNVLGEDTLFEGISMLPPGPRLRVAADGTTQRRTYFDPIPIASDESSAIPNRSWSSCRAVLQRAVDRQLMSDVPLGAYLSGGMDSASLVALAARRIPHIHTFTAGFDLTDASPLELAADERGDAEIVAREVGTEHYEAVLHAGDMERVLPRWSGISRISGPEPRTRITTWRGSHRSSSRWCSREPAATSCLPGTRGGIRTSSRSARARLLATSTTSYWCRLVPDGKSASCSPPTHTTWPRPCPRESVRPGHLAPPRTRADRPALYFEQRTFLHGLLVVEDKLSMAHSMEARVPLLDNELVDFSLRLPGKLKNMSPPASACCATPLATSCRRRS